MLQPLLRTALHVKCVPSTPPKISKLTSLRCRTFITLTRRMASVPISSPPADGQLVEIEGSVYATKKEGLAYILIPPGTQTSVEPPRTKKGGKAKAGFTAGAEPVKPQNVFYNPVQQFNRDLSVLAIRAFGEDWVERKRARSEKFRGREGRKAKKRKIEEVEGEEAAVKVNRGDGEEAEASKEIANGTVEEAAEPIVGGAEVDTVAVDGPGESATTQPNANQGHRPRFRVLDALSASGLRALRYAKEIPCATSIVANDMSPNAIKSMNMNIQHNDLSASITPNTGDAIGHMYSVAFPPTNAHGPTHINRRYDVIDLDPYGTAAPFLDAALHALNDGGLLCVTCTDSGVFASCGYSEKTFSLYGGLPIKGNHMHEGGLRLIIQSIASAGAKNGLAIEPLLSLSIDFYVRIFVRVRKSPADVKFLAGKTMLVYGCDAGCGAWSTQLLGRNVRQIGKDGKPDWFKHPIAQGPSTDRLCAHCRSKTHVAGPMWAGSLHNPAFIEKILADLEGVDASVYQTKDRVEGMLTTALDELLVNDAAMQPAAGELIPKTPPHALDAHPFFFNPSALSKVVHCVAPPDAAIRGALRHAGYRATRSHCQPGSIKTDAPWALIWKIMREWVRQKAPVREDKIRVGSPGWWILHPAGEGTANGGVEENGDAGGGVNSVDEVVVNGANPTTEEGGADRNDAEPVNVEAASDGKTGDEKAKEVKIVFDEELGRDKPGKRLVRYQQNPRENWGPMARAKGS